MRKPSLTALVLLSVATLGACAANRAHMASAGPSDLDRLRAQCDARGGILVPTGRFNANPALENVCKINNPTTPFLPRS